MRRIVLAGARQLSSASEATRVGLAGVKHMPLPPAAQVDGKLAVVDSATVICLRHRGSPESRAPDYLPRSRFEGEGLGVAGGAPRSAGSSLDKIFGGLEELDFTSGWEVLLGQSECINWLRSTGSTAETGLRLMRYPGEFKLAGGVVDEGETFQQAARRELEEEFLAPAGIELPPTAKLRPFTVKQTLPIRSKSNIMWNFVALAEENPWLASLDVDVVNQSLAQKRQRFQEMLRSGEYWKLPTSAREAFAPEVRELCWMPLCESMWLMLSTMPGNGTAHFTNEFQRREFARLGIAARDPMFITAAALLEVESFPEPAALIRHCRRLEASGGMAEEQGRIQWLFAGMTAQDFRSAATGRGEPNEMIKDWPQVRRLRAEHSLSLAKARSKL